MPSRFHGHLWSSKSRINPTFGLVHRHYPLTKILSMEWTPKETQRAWHKFNNIGNVGHELTYQLWPYPPWEEASRRQSTSNSLLARLLKRGSVSRGGEPNKPGSHTETSRPLWEKKSAPSERQIRMQVWNQCALGPSIQLPRTVDMASYTAFRRMKRHERCKRQSAHEEFSQQCELCPWPHLQDLRDDLQRSIQYWKTLIQARDTIPRFTDGLTEAVEDYKNFMLIFRNGIARFKKGHFVSKFDPKMVGEKPASEPTGASQSRFDRLMPPTLEIDLLWRTHRLFPGQYWEFSLIRALWVAEPERTLNADSARVLLAETRQEWKKNAWVECPRKNAVGEWFESYLPDTARPARRGVAREPLEVLLDGRNEVAPSAHKYRVEGYNPGGGGGGASGDSSGCGGDGGGGGGE
ncbi:hypothetical protein ACHAQH_006381 [Verticillium albo-atrum]